ncbi:microtubule cytoskeleton organization [Spatholobus suberectus]|nr:microtubule cytoskeleton organization [Spatholobus suberectus]
MKDRHSQKRLESMVEPDKNCETRVEDLAWLYSLSESEIDMLISLKLLIIQRAKMIGYKELANKSNLKMIRAIALVLMEHLKAEIKDSSLVPNKVKSTAFLDACNLLKYNNEVDANIDELSTSLGADIQTFLRSPPTSKRKKQKVGSRE